MAKAGAEAASTQAEMLGGREVPVAQPVSDRPLLQEERGARAAVAALVAVVVPAQAWAETLGPAQQPSQLKASEAGAPTETVAGVLEPTEVLDSMAA